MTVVWGIVVALVSFFFGAQWAYQRLRAAAMRGAQEAAHRAVQERVGELIELSNSLSPAERQLGPEDPEEHDRKVREILERSFDLS